MKVDIDTMALRRRVEKATVEALNETVEAAAERATGKIMQIPAHKAAGYRWWGLTERKETAVGYSPAKRLSSGRVGARFGATKRRGKYAFLLEKYNPYIRPSADAEYPQLAKRVARRLGNG